MISVIIPTIRTHFWTRVLDSLAQSCINHEYEVIFIGPFVGEFDLPRNVTFIQSYCSVPVCIQIATLQAKYDYVVHTTDDGVFLSNSLDVCLDYYFQYKTTNFDALSLRYSEGVNFVDNVRPPEFFKVKHCIFY